MVNKGDIVLVKFPFSQDISKAKAVLLLFSG
jgi:hypothetical protein